MDGKIYIIGGNVHNKQLGKEVSTGLVEVYDPLTERWERLADMPTERGWLNVAVVDGKIYVIGGFILLEQGLGLDVDRFSRRIEEYNPKTNSWRRLPRHAQHSNTLFHPLLWMTRFTQWVAMIWTIGTHILTS